ncbi:unnamed protein product [Adineta ricciae]|uniref:Uncharacterized protein n=1 Tax=Adineta ricciae TaxID=249248 RepID=A0A814RJD1_ADIRI|nr:unnamed protein product [Adineta ricciae]
MNLKTFFNWISKIVSDYNLFMLEENDYNDDTIRDPTIILKKQKYQTWLYVVFLTVGFYVLFYSTLNKSEYETMMISDITFDNYHQFYSKYGQTFSCPCSQVIIPYKTFLSNNVTMHSVCSSIFVKREWIEGLYYSNASWYMQYDFRIVAYSQFEILSKLCSLSNEIISQIQSDVNNTELVTINLLSQMQIKLEINNTIEFQKTNAFGRIRSFLKYWRTTIQRNFLISALGTNWQILARYSESKPVLTGFSKVYYLLNSSAVVCGIDNPIIQTFLPSPLNYSKYLGQQWIRLSDHTSVNGFFTGCTPFEALLQSTMDCLYDLECILWLLNYFPNLNHTNKFHWNNLILSSKHDNKTVLVHFENLFIENWLLNMNYSTYFNQCSPSTCSYSTKIRSNFSSAFTLLISLYGGLIIIFRLIVSFLIDSLFKYKYSQMNTNENTFKPIETLKQLNLFKNINHRSENDIQQQRITTRIYLVLLIGSISVLCLFNSLSTEIVTTTISNPSLTTYKSFESIYSTTLQCPCANKTMTFGTFLSFSPVFHQICSSGFVTDDWIYHMMNNILASFSIDWRAKAYQQFQILSDLCQLANTVINAAMNKFLSQFFVASSIMNEIDFNQQLYSYINQFYQSTTLNFVLMNDIIQLTQRIDQLHEEFANQRGSGSYFENILTINAIERKVYFIPYGVEDINTGLVTCVCAINPNCQRSAIVTDFDPIQNTNYLYGSFMHNISGWIEGCLSSDSLLLSTLECLYENSHCFPFLLSYIKKANTETLSLPTSSFRLRPLTYDPKVNRYPPNTSISMIVNELMLEKWNPVSSYEKFYESCAPVYCSYTENVRKQNFFGIIITLVSMIGGIVLSLSILTPHLVKFVSGFSTMYKKDSNQTEQILIQVTFTNRLKMKIYHLIKLLRTTLRELNIFSLRDFGSDIDRILAKRYGRWATRLYFILFMIGLTILMFYTVIRPHTMKIIFTKPSFTYYKDLKKLYNNDLTCPCSNIASKYNQFVNIQPIFHSICLSEFISNEWRIGLTNGLVSNLSIYERTDYRRFLSAHLEYLQRLCQISMETANNSINEFLSSLLVTTELLSEKNFNDRLNNLIEQNKLNAPVVFSQLLFFTQSIIHGNAFETIYGTNFEYINIDENGDTFVLGKSIIYDNNNCSCGLSSKCTTQAIFIDKNSSQNISIKGMKMGCIPSESLLASTLECFYDQLCLNFIQNYTNYQNSSKSLSITNLTHFSQNTTIEKLRQNLFIEQWLTIMNYSLYYQKCSPLLCFYISIEQFNIFYTITIILGLQGGLTIVLKWICPKFIQIGLKIYYYRKKTKCFCSSY